MNSFINFERVRINEDKIAKKKYYISLGQIAVRKENIISIAEEVHYDGYFLDDTTAAEVPFQTFSFLKVVYKTTPDKTEELLVVNNTLEDVIAQL